ncbi:MAG: hypothetical protein ACLP9L_15740 [Thermoguttaceae bacterium]
MSTSAVNLSTLKCVGTASCVGGKHPDPPLDKFPLLAWMVSHPRHGSKVFTEDGAASVEDIAIDATQMPSYEALAAKHGTTAEHVRQAIDYALAAKFLS